MFIFTIEIHRRDQRYELQRQKSELVDFGFHVQEKQFFINL